MSEETAIEEVTEVQEIDVNLNELLGIGTDGIMTSNEPKRTIFSDITPDTSFLDKKDTPETVAPETIATPAKPEDEGDTAVPTPEAEATPAAETEDVLAAPDPNAPPVIEDKNKGGRPTTVVAVAKSLIDSKVLLPFDDEKKVEDYTAEDFQELIQSNLKHKEEALSKEVPQQFFNSLPKEMQDAYEYIANGGTDIKGIFASLAATSEVRDLDVTKEEDQKYAIRSYLQATQYGSPEEIEDEIRSLEDRSELEKKAKQFKPKLDAMQQNVLNQRLATQEASAKTRHDQSQKYIESIYATLEKGELNGLKLDNKTQNMLYAGLVQSNYPSTAGGQTNMLGHLLEQHQWVNPNHGLVAEALWLLSDPDAYRASVGQGVEKTVNEQTLRTLKTEQSNKAPGSAVEDIETGGSARKAGGLARPKRNFFARKN